MEEITQRGGWVIRLGDEAMLPLPDMNRVIDYPFSGLKLDEMNFPSWHMLRLLRDKRI
jgi:hypothetical protein